MDHSACPTKREIIRKRASEARDKKTAEAQANKRELELITRLLDYTNTENWPHLQNNTQQLKVSLALIDEAVNTGVFQEKLTKHCEMNKIPKVTYNL